MPTQRACQLIMMYSKRTFPSELALMWAISGGEYSRALFDLSNRLSYVGCREEALQAILEAVDLRRSLAAGHPATMQSLDHLSIRLSDLGRREHALEAILEAVGLRRHFAADCRVQCGSCIFPGKSLQPSVEPWIPRGCTGGTEFASATCSRPPYIQSSTNLQPGSRKLTQQFLQLSVASQTSRACSGGHSGGGASPSATCSRLPCRLQCGSRNVT